MRSFASDNNSSVHPEVLQAIIKANEAHAVGYGDDLWTEKAKDLLKAVFGLEAESFFVFNGTGANSVALKTLTRSFHAVLAADTAHVLVDECGAPARFSGCAFIGIKAEQGKLSPELIKPYLHGFGDPHHSQPKVVYISQATELGTLYTLEELKELTTFLHQHDMYLHMDGARLANACVALGCSMKEMTVDCGVDILSLGGTKNGMMMGEAVVTFRPELSALIPYYRKQATQLASKMRYMSCQFIPYLEQEIWKKNAQHANAMAVKLKNSLMTFPNVSLVYPLESNALFLKIPKACIERLRKEYFFYTWDEEEGVIRLVTSWDTTDEDVDSFVEIFAKVMASKS